MKGSKMLRIISIVMMVLAIIGIVSALITMVGGAACAAASTGIEGEDGEIVAAAGGMIIVFGVIMLIGYLIELVAAVLGVKNWDKPEKAKSCMIIGVIILVIQLIGGIGGMVNNGFNFDTVWSLVAGVAIPVVYVAGAFQLKKQA